MIKETRLRSLNRQLNRLEAQLTVLRRTSYRYSWLRMGVFALGAASVALALVLDRTPLAVALFLGALFLFGTLVYVHRRIEVSIERHKVWSRHQKGQIARATLDWEGIPTTFHHRARLDHPFEADLDLVGERSLMRLLDVAVSYEGSQRLREWLSAPIPDPAQIHLRQQRVRELAPRSLFRAKLMLHSVMAAGGQRNWRAGDLADWLGRHESQPSLGRWLLLLGALAGLNAALFAAHWMGWLPPVWQLTFVLYIGLTLVQARVADALAAEAVDLDGILRQLRDVFRHLETYSYQGAPHLLTLCRPFRDPEHRPSRHVGRLALVVAAMGVRSNPLIRIALNALVPWDLFFAHRLNRQKASLARFAPAWMDAWFELEALCSLANLAYLSPAYVFPKISTGKETAPYGAAPDDAPIYAAWGLGHPLLPDAEKVSNDVSFPELGQVTLVTGSNMAGKSVFLKTVAVSLVLAYAGGPVSARRLHTKPLRIFTCMGIRDSVTDGISYFYAEVKRLKALLDALQADDPMPLFFCIDEIFRGTNNRERLAGSRAYIRALAGQCGVGLIATHDLDLARLADDLPQVRNVHFRDHIVEDRMAFDYILRPGPCPTTNALKIMRVEGLPVPDDAED